VRPASGCLRGRARRTGRGHSESHHQNNAEEESRTHLGHCYSRDVNPTPASSPSALLVELTGGAPDSAIAVALIAGLFLFAGTFVGFFLTRSNEARSAARQFEHEDHVRWQRDVREVAADFATLCLTIREQSLRLNFTLGKMKIPRPWNRIAWSRNDAIVATHYDGLIASKSKLMALLAHLLIIAPEKVRAKAIVLASHASNLDSNGTTELDKRSREMDVIHSEFLGVVRENLKVDRRPNLDQGSSTTEMDPRS